MLSDDEFLGGSGGDGGDPFLCYFGGYGFFEGERDVHESFAVDAFLLCLEVEQSEMWYSFKAVVILHMEQ